MDSIQQATDALIQASRNDLREQMFRALAGELPPEKPTSNSHVRKLGTKRDPAVIRKLTTSLASHIFRNPGQRIEQIGVALGVPTKELALPVKKLIAEKAVRTRGQKRAMAYYPASKGAH